VRPGSGWRASRDPGMPERLDLDGFAGMFEDHAAHVFDYCRSLAGRDDVAADATEFALISAQAAAPDPGRARAWLFALARRQVLALDPAFWPPPDSDQEILDLVYRHGIHTDELPGVLGVPADAALDRLASAEDAAAAGWGPSVELLADLPLAAVPDSVWRHSVGAALAADAQHARHRSGRAGSLRRSIAWPEPGRRRVRVATMAAIPAAAIIAAVVYLAGPSGPVGSRRDCARRPRRPRSGPNARMRPRRRRKAPPT